MVVVVSRQVEGPMLGGRRFGHFLNCARELLAQCGYDQRGQHGKQQPAPADTKPKTKAAAARYGGRGGHFPAGSGGGRERRQYAPTKKEASYSNSRNSIARSQRHKEH